MAVTIQAVSTAREKKLFIRLPWTIYRDDPHWVPPLLMERQDFLNPAKNPFFDHSDVRLFLARDAAGEVVGRIAAIVNENHLAQHHEKAGFFGLFECVDSQEAACRLFDAAGAFLRSKGMEVMRGPENLSINDDIGLLIKGFDSPPFLMMPHNPAYYERLVTSYGFARAKDLYTWFIDVTPGTEDPKMRRYFEVAEKAKARSGLRIRGVDMSRFDEEVALLFKLYNDSWQRNWGFVPVSEPEFKAIAHDLRQIVEPSLVLVVEDKTGTPVAFSVTLPDVNEIMPRDGRLFPFGWWKLLTGRKRIRYARLFTLGVMPSHRKRGVESLLCIDTALRARELGMRGGEIGWTLEDNVLINRTVESFGGRLDRRYRLFGLSLS